MGNRKISKDDEQGSDSTQTITLPFGLNIEKACFVKFIRLITPGWLEQVIEPPSVIKQQNPPQLFGDIQLRSFLVKYKAIAVLMAPKSSCVTSVSFILAKPMNPNDGSDL